jgi:hypothetical protein
MYNGEGGFGGEMMNPCDTIQAHYLIETEKLSLENYKLREENKGLKEMIRSALRSAQANPSGVLRSALNQSRERKNGSC